MQPQPASTQLPSIFGAHLQLSGAALPTWDNGREHAWTQVHAALSQATWARALQGAPHLAA
eukprot:1738100-Prymnesium_polylepis.1